MAKVDAKVGSIQKIIPCEAIDLEVLKKLETDMDDYDKVSCLFLIIDDYKRGYETFVNCERHASTMISDFIRDNQVTDWQDKILEAICLIQNNKISENLGISSDDAKTLFITRTAEISIKINKYAKAFYCLFDNLTTNDESKLLEKVYEEITAPQISRTSPANDSLEIHLLWWIREGFIDISGDVWNLKRILAVLKTLELTRSDGYDALKKYQSNNSCRYDDQLSGDRPATQNFEKNDSDTMQNETKTDIYKSSTGLGIVFNQMQFPYSSKYEYRHGSEEDCKLIKTTFGENFGYEVEIHENLKKEEIYSVLDNLKDRAKNYDCLVVFILSHGTCGNIISSDGLECAIDEIRDKVCSEELLGKPKVLVIQACQTRATLKTDGPASQTKSGRFRDFLLLRSTISGDYSVRDCENGTWYIQTFCKVLLDTSRRGRSIEYCVRKVNNSFAEKGSVNIGGNLIDQVPETTGTLIKRLIFPCKAASSG